MSAAPDRCIVCGDSPEPLLATRGLRILRCPGCGLQWRYPFPDYAELRRLYGSDYLDRWGADGAEALTRVRAMKERTYRGFLDALPPQPDGARLLDVGCALGFLLGVARGRGFEAYGIDVNASAVAQARSEFGERVTATPLEADPFPGLGFEVVTLVDVLEHVPDPVQLLSAVHGRLEPGGRILAVLPNAGGFMARLLRARWPHYAPEHLYHWAPSSVSALLERSGFRVEQLRTGIRKTFTASYLSAYAAAVDVWLPPGLGYLGDRAFRVPTGEMLVVGRAASAG